MPSHRCLTYLSGAWDAKEKRSEDVTWGTVREGARMTGRLSLGDWLDSGYLLRQETILEKQIWRGLK